MAWRVVVGTWLFILWYLDVLFFYIVFWSASAGWCGSVQAGDTKGQREDWGRNQWQTGLGWIVFCFVFSSQMWHIYHTVQLRGFQSVFFLNSNVSARLEMKHINQYVNN